jgi:DNA replication protein DnaC
MTNSADKLAVLLRTLKLPSFKAQYEDFARQAEREGWTFARYLMQLAEAEIEDRRARRIERLLRQSGLPKDKTLATLDQKRLPAKVRRQLPTLCDGSFVQRTENVLAFGLPGRGKTHCLSAVGHELVHRGHEVLFRPAFAIVQRLLAAKRELTLEKELRRLDRYSVVILDDIGYVQQDREEMEVLFTFLAERYERRSVMITSNLVFSQWDQVFKDPMTTAAAIDRVVHHSVILELTGDSYRSHEAQKRNAEPTPKSKQGTAKQK